MNRLNQLCRLFGIGLGIAVALPVSAQFDREAYRANRAELNEALRAREAAFRAAQGSTLVILTRDGDELASLETLPSYVTNARLSPDASRAIQVHEEDPGSGRSDLYLYDVASEVTSRLTESVVGDSVLGFAWSPDSRELAILAVRDGRYDIYRRALADSDVGDGELLYTTAAPLQLGDWSADGRYVSFTTEPLLAEQSTLVIDLEAGGEPQVIMDGSLPVLAPRFSPDGRHQVFLSFNPVEQSLVLYSANAAPGRDEEPQMWELPIPADSAATNPDSLFWSADGRELYFCDGQDRTMKVPVNTGRGDYRFEADDARPASLNEQIRARYPGAGCYSQSPDGSHLRFPIVPEAVRQQVVMFDRDGDELMRFGEVGTWSAPAFSPDGSRILAALQAEGSAITRPSFRVFDVASGETESVGDPVPFGHFPVWMPDQDYLAYGTLDPVDGTIFSSIYRMSVDGEGERELLWRSEPDVVTSQLVDIAPDGSYLAINPWANINAMPLTDSEPAPPTSIDMLVGAFDVGVARFSPDMQHVAYTYDISGRPEVYVTAFDAATGTADMDASHQVSNLGVAGGLTWRDDGGELYFLSDMLDTPELNDFRVMAVSIDTDGAFSAGESRVLFEVELPLAVTTIAQLMSASSLVHWRIASSDGDRFVFVLDSVGEE